MGTVMKLVNFLKKLRNEQVTIELKNGTTVWGTLQSVSPQMNATLTDVKLSLPHNKNSSRSKVVNPTALASLYLIDNQSNNVNDLNGDTTTSLQYINIRGNTIRQIILPDSLNLDSLLVDERQLNKLRKIGKVSDDQNRKRRRDFGDEVGKRPRRNI
ncbi:hypothetical protein TPHA_0A00850 [Tetrapisispora phaffii CBS 4417]|uniref:Sm domain-containing protein n=1 Tax=Tetrapisispora phaffii (strain ATCC 24235 / CBS 4417 / NBRC 1672 / NRRL Y-8282 / UCD 70-5) TaxID=1071381 RepID=G8BMP2_TETPH|nr:hypothetical protein TPHA_0A00850 [Tetrapisispora phaffii CBS 4417]CCE61170.1 hypothetical protein TPHA_0A00850 [Tetrapisispora phaffii CBS 4417]